MSIETRRDMLVRYLRENGRTSVKELADYFNITGATVRSDLRFLEQAQLVMRRYGGAEAFNGAALEDRTMDEKTTLNLNIKQRIGAKAASLVQNGESIVDFHFPLINGDLDSLLVRNCIHELLQLPVFRRCYEVSIYTN